MTKVALDYVQLHTVARHLNSMGATVLAGARAPDTGAGCAISMSAPKVFVAPSGA